MLGHIEVVSSTVFDAGVYLVVIGLVLDVLRSLGAEVDRQQEMTSDRTQRAGAHMSVSLTLVAVMARAVRVRHLSDARAEHDAGAARIPPRRQRDEPAHPRLAGRARLAPFPPSASAGRLADPLPQAFVLTSIVITFGVSAFLWR